MDEIAIAIGKLVYVIWVWLIMLCISKGLVWWAHFYFSMKKKFYDDIKENEFNSK